MSRAAMSPAACLEAMRWLRSHRINLAPLTGQDSRALEAIAHVWQLHAVSDDAGKAAAIAAVRALRGAMQRSCTPIAKELIALAGDWSDREPLWSLVTDGEPAHWTPPASRLLQPGTSLAPKWTDRDGLAWTEDHSDARCRQCLETTSAIVVGDAQPLCLACALPLARFSAPFGSYVKDQNGVRGMVVGTARVMSGLFTGRGICVDVDFDLDDRAGRALTGFGALKRTVTSLRDDETYHPIAWAVAGAEARAQ